MASIFSKIISGEIPCHKVAETEDCLAFLDIFPIAEGHTLVIPKQEVDNIFDLDSVQYAKLFDFARTIAKAIEKTHNCKKVGMAVIGLEVAHAHIHLLPVNEVYDLDFRKDKLKFEPEQFAAIAARIALAIE
jgi:histidine triad (HIT) family protein